MSRKSRTLEDLNDLQRAALLWHIDAQLGPIDPTSQSQEHAVDDIIDAILNNPDNPNRLEELTTQYHKHLEETIGFRPPSAGPRSPAG